MFHDELLEIEEPDRPELPVEKVHNFYVTTIGGLEDVVLKDLKAHLKSLTHVRVERGRRHGRIFFTYTRSPKHLLNLRSVEQVFALLDDIRGVTVGHPGLLRIAERVARVDLVPAAVLHDILHGSKVVPGFQLSCTVGSRHRFSASEMHQVVRTVLDMKYEVDLEEAERPYPLRLQMIGKRALFGLQLSDRTVRERTYRRVRVDGDPEPVLAYCLSLILGIDPRDILLDPRCGGATALVEIGLGNKVQALIGGDVYPQVLLAASENLQEALVPGRLMCFHATDLPFRDATVDKAVGNLRRRKGEPPLFLSRWVGEIHRVLRPGRRAVFLFDGRKQAREGIDEVGGFEILKEQTIHLRGKRPSVCLLQKVG